MSQLKDLHFMIPCWSPSLFALVDKRHVTSKLKILKLSIDGMDDPMQNKHQGDVWARWIRKLAESPLRSLTRLELSAHHILHQPKNQQAILSLLQTHTTLQHLIVVDHNIFDTPPSGTSTTASGRKPTYDSSKSIIFATQLAHALQQQHHTTTPSQLRELQLLSKSTTKSTQANKRAGRRILSQALESNYHLERLELSHCGVRVSVPRSTLASLPLRALPEQWSKPPDPLAFYLQLNQDGYRRQLLVDKNITTPIQELWWKAMLFYQHDTPKVFALLQACPSCLSYIGTQCWLSGG